MRDMKLLRLAIILSLGWPTVLYLPASIGPTRVALALDPEKTFDMTTIHGTWRVDTFTGCEKASGKISNFTGKLKHTLVITADAKMMIEIEDLKFYEWTVEYEG